VFWQFREDCRCAAAGTVIRRAAHRREAGRDAKDDGRVEDWGRSMCFWFVLVERIGLGLVGGPETSTLETARSREGW